MALTRTPSTPEWSKLSVIDRMAAARHKALTVAPYFAAVIYAFMPREAKGLGTIGVSAGSVLLYDPEWVAQWSPGQLAGLMVHEALHLVANHAGRCGTRCKSCWNLAGDLWINPQVKAMGFELPPNGVWPRDFGFAENLTADQYYELIQKKRKKDNKKSSSGCSHDDDEKTDSGKEKGPAAGKCGGCAGNPAKGEEGDGETGTGGMSRSDADMERMRVRVAEAIKKHAAERGRGTVPGGLLDWADFQLEPPKIRWEDELARSARRAVAYRPGAIDYKHDRPSRKQAGVGFGPGKPVLAVLRSPIPRVCFVVDTSGSMGDEQLKEAVNHGHAVIRATGAAVDYIACDAAVHVDQKMRDGRQIAKEGLKGRGGTAFQPVIDLIIKKRDPFDVVVFVTDGQGDQPPRPPTLRAHWIWVLVGPYACQPADWGQCIYTDDARRADVAKQQPI